MEYAEKVLVHHPDHVDAMYLKGRIEAARGRTDQAISAFKAVVPKRPDLEEGYLQLAQVHILDGNSNLAARYLMQSKKENTMPSNVVNLKDRLKQRWADRRDQQEKAQVKKYISSGKMSVVCKCPKCEIEHRLLIRWAGRGIPRVFCAACRAMIVGMDDSTIDMVGNYAAKSARKPIYQGYE